MSAPASRMGPRMASRRCWRVSPGDQVLTSVHGLGQPLEGVAFAQKIGAHRQHDVNRGRRLLGKVQQEGHEIGGFFPDRGRPGPLKTEQLLELVHHHQQVAVLAVQRVPQPLGKKMPPAALDRLLPVLRGRLGAGLPGGLCQGRGQIEDRRVPRLEDRDLPQVPILDQKPGLQVGDQPRPHQGGFAAAGAADHRHEPVGVELLQQGVALLLAAEVIEAVAALKRS